MSLALASEAIERGSCLELYFRTHCIVIDPQVAGCDEAGHPIVLGVERSSEKGAPLARWLLLRLDKAVRVDVSGYLSDGPRCGSNLGYGQFRQITATAH